MNDEQFEQILDGIIGQSEINQYEEDNSKNIRTIVYCSNSIGQQSISKIEKLIPSLVELKLCNLQMPNNLLINSLLESYINCDENLMKLTLSSMNLRSKQILKSLVLVIQNKKKLQYLDLNSTNMNAHSLLLLTNELVHCTQQYRDINLSYNCLCFQENDEQYNASVVVLKNLRHIIDQSTILNHINLSGMKFTESPILQICNSCVQSKLIMSIHLNDNDITTNKQLFKDALEIFQLSEVDNLRNNQILKSQILKNNNGQDLSQMLKKYMRAQSPSNIDKKEKQQVDDFRLKIKDNIVIGKLIKDVQTQKQINNCKKSQGAGKNPGTFSDHFVVSRILNHPELIFNQNINNDNDFKLRFFQKDFEDKWKLSLKNECLICDRWQFLQIFYQRGVMAQNQDLIEINDQSILKELEYDFQKNYLAYQSYTPIICGSIVKKYQHQNIFERKLKMLRTPIFALLSILLSKDFSYKDSYVSNIKQGIQNFLKYDNIQLLKELKVDVCFKGWEKVLNDFSLNNEITDLKIVNFPNLNDQNINKQEWFTFAGFFTPGYHKFLIYDPLLKRAFFKDTVIQLNQRDFVFPEYPVPQSELTIKDQKNIWINWRELNKNDIEQIIVSEVCQFEFQILKFMRVQSEFQECIMILKNYYDLINIFQRELLVRNKYYPLISMDNLVNKIMNIQESSNFKGNKISSKQCEIQYISTSCRKNNTFSSKSQKSMFQRSELLDYILRIAKIYVTENYSFQESVSKHFQDFLLLYFGEMSLKSNQIVLRKIIRQSYRLNELIFDNVRGIESIYDDEKKKLGRGLLDLDTAKQFFKRFVGNGMMEIDDLLIEDSFVYSMMTVINEQKNIRKYNYLILVEFLEMICRVAYLGFAEQEPIEYKVFWLLEYMWKEKYSQGDWTQKSMPLIPLSTDIMW